MRNISILKLTAVELGYNFGTKAPHRPNQLLGLARAAMLHLYCACSIAQLAQKSKPILCRRDSPNTKLPQLFTSGYSYAACLPVGGFEAEGENKEGAQVMRGKGGQSGLMELGTA